MPRNISADMLSSLSAGYLRPALFAAVSFKNEDVYVWTGVGSIVFGGNTYLGVGTLGTISTIEETSGVTAKGITLELSGLNPQAINDTLGSWQIGLPVTLYLGVFTVLNTTSAVLIDSPIISWSGRMDAPTVTIGGETCTISIAAESRLADMNSSVELRYTFEQSQIDNPGDMGFQYVNQIQAVPIFFGQGAPATASNTSQGNR
jgi:hypothetical protein